jgi:hypothetical protein
MMEPAAARPNLLEARIKVPEHVVHRPFPTETVVLNLETGKYHGLNLIAGRMLEELERQGTVAGAAVVLADVYDVSQEEIQGDLCELCSDLANRGLIELAHDPDR